MNKDFELADFNIFMNKVIIINYLIIIMKIVKKITIELIL